MKANYVDLQMALYECLFEIKMAHKWINEGAEPNVAIYLLNKRRSEIMKRLDIKDD